MKHSAIAFTALAVLLAMGCQKTETKTISVNVKVDETKLKEAGIDSPETYEVKLSNFSTGVSVQAKTENGIATAAGLVPGVYNVTVGASQNVGGFSYTIAGAQSNVSLLKDGDEVVVSVDAVKEAALVFKEIYYTGFSYTPIDPTTGKPAVDPETGNPATTQYFRDQFYEIYNNSTEVVFADSLCIATIVYANYNYSIIYDWPIENKEQYVFASVIWQIPGEGNTYPIQPGESIIISQWGTNHKAQNLTEGNAPVDLSGAEFEAVEKETTFGGIVLTDNPAVNMKKAVNALGYSVPQWLTPVSGAGYIIFKPSKALKDENYLIATNNDFAGKAREVLISDVIDAVQSVSDETGMMHLGLPQILDAGGIWCSGNYVGESIARKIKETRPDGTIVYQDSNNTTNDFEVKKDPQLRRNGAKKPSWNTWHK